MTEEAKITNMVPEIVAAYRAEHTMAPRRNRTPLKFEDWQRQVLAASEDYMHAVAELNYPVETEEEVKQ